MITTRWTASPTEYSAISRTLPPRVRMAGSASCASSSAAAPFMARKLPPTLT